MPNILVAFDALKAYDSIWFSAHDLFDAADIHRSLRTDYTIVWEFDPDLDTEAHFQRYQTSLIDVMLYFWKNRTKKHSRKIPIVWYCGDLMENYGTRW